MVDNMLDSDEIFKSEGDETYITALQMRFFLNRDDGYSFWKTRSPEFIRYYNMCRVYNLVSEFLHYDPTSAIVYWDPDREGVSLAFPPGGVVGVALSSLGFLSEENSGYERGSSIKEPKNKPK